MTLALAASHGAQVGPAYVGPRYVAHSSEVRDQSIPSSLPAAWIPLAEADDRLDLLSRAALSAQKEGRPIYRVLAREAESLCVAIAAARQAQRAAGLLREKLA